MQLQNDNADCMSKTALKCARNVITAINVNVINFCITSKTKWNSKKYFSHCHCNCSLQKKYEFLLSRECGSG